jgi:AcrR family transcriptional regulator
MARWSAATTKTGRPKPGRGRPARGENLYQEAIRSAGMGRIAEEAQVTRASRYRHFPAKMISSSPISARPVASCIVRRRALSRGGFRRPI